MANYMEFRPILSEIAKSLRLISAKHSAKPSAGTQALGNPLTLNAGFTSLRIKKTNATGTVNITFPDASVYILAADGEEVTLSGSTTLGQFSVNAVSGATYKFYTV